jgi:SAM-dependent methyltransferase
VATAPDGSPVELYALLPELGEVAHVRQAVPPGCSILELGCGAGWITRRLVEAGYHVTAVDESTEMLAHVAVADTVCARIEGLELGRRFDAALLAGNLLNVADPERRAAFLEACRRHADRTVVEALPLGWQPEDGEGRLGEVATRLRVAGVDGRVVHGSVEYTLDARSWSHDFSLYVFADRGELDDALAQACLRLDCWLDRDGGRWFVASSA